jgi:hypothetical protein
MPVGCAKLCSPEDREGSHTCYIMLTCSFCRFMQAGLKQLAWCREAFHELVVQDVTEFDYD